MSQLPLLPLPASSATNSKLHAAKDLKNDEFYTQFADIQNEIFAYHTFDPNVFRDKTVLLPCDDPEWSNFTKFFALNFDHFGLRKLISTSYVRRGKGKVFTLTRNPAAGERTRIENIQAEALNGNGDFRSPEVGELLDESDFVITNPPFSLFREFLSFVTSKNKSFSMIGNMNAITYKEVFPLIMSNQIWLGRGFSGGNAFFASPHAKQYGAGVYQPDTGLVKFRNACWFTNIDHNHRHEPLSLTTMAENKRFNKRIRGTKAYQKYDNYDAIEVPSTLAIPSDYSGVMGVPISFLSKYSPDQFEIVRFRYGNDGKDLAIQGKTPYFRILIRHRTAE